MSSTNQSLPASQLVLVELVATISSMVSESIHSNRSSQFALFRECIAAILVCSD
ncbi:MAG: hypothetical protein P8J27_17380 [Mariniblastus sp.]|nr:hypothetical protein [Mariniblastus sp.]